MTVIMAPGNTELSNLLTVLSDPKGAQKLAQKAAEIEAARNELIKEQASFVKEKQEQAEIVATQRAALEKTKELLDSHEKQLSKALDDISKRDTAITAREVTAQKTNADIDKETEALIVREKMVSDKELMLSKRDVETAKLQAELTATKLDYDTKTNKIREIIK